MSIFGLCFGIWECVFPVDNKKWAKWQTSKGRRNTTYLQVSLGCRKGLSSSVQALGHHLLSMLFWLELIFHWINNQWGLGPGMTMRVGPANKGGLYLLANPFVSVRFVGTNDDFLLYNAILANCSNEIPGCSDLQNCHLLWISINHLCLSHVLNLIINNQNQNHFRSAQFFCREVG